MVLTSPLNIGDAMKVKSRKEINMVKSKFMMGVSSREDLSDALDYIFALESLVEEASRKDFYGPGGWEARLDWIHRD